MRAFADDAVDTVVFMCGAQMGKTELQFNVLGWMWETRPRPSIYVTPTQKLAVTLSRDRINKMLQTAPGLWGKVDRRYNKPGSLERWIGGVRFGLAWAGSATELASHPCAMVMVDERSRMDDVIGEGDPVRLAMARTKNYPGSKVGVFSTPTEEDVCPTYAWWLTGSKMRWSWQCPGCGTWFPPEIQHARYPDGADYPTIRTESVIECPECKRAIHDDDRAGLAAQYVPYVADSEGRLEQALGVETRNSVASYWATGFASPFTGIGEIMEQYARAVRDGEPGDLQASVNTYGGELWKVRGDRVSADAVKDRRTDVLGDIQMVTVGVDVQQDCLYYRVRGWGPGVTSWGIQYGRLEGSTEFDDVWLALARTLDGTFCGLRPAVVMVDSGYNTAQVYEVCRRHGWRPSKGSSSMNARPYWDTAVDETVTGRQKRTLLLWNYNADTWKSWLYSRIQWEDGTPGAWYCEATADDDYCAQVVNEARVVRKGRVEWVTTKSRQNHYLDCEVLCSVAAHVANVRTLRAKPKREAPTTGKARETGGSGEFSFRSL